MLSNSMARNYAEHSVEGKRDALVQGTTLIGIKGYYKQVSSSCEPVLGGRGSARPI